MSGTDLPVLTEDFQFETPVALAESGPGFFDDVIVVRLPHLEIISEEDFSKVLAMRQPVTDRAGKPQTRHPLSGKWKCCRCGETLRMDVRRRWLRCDGATSAWRDGQENTCDAPPIDLPAAERLMFEALETFAPGRNGAFTKVARERYDQVIRLAQSERKQLKEDAAYHRGEIKKLVRELVQGQDNRALRESIQEVADEHERILNAIEAKLNDAPVEVDDPDPITSLLELQNMIDAIKQQTPFGFGVNKEALTLRSRLCNVISTVIMSEKGDDVYDIEFVLDRSVAMDITGKDKEIVRFTDESLKAGSFKTRNKLAGYEAKWKAGKFSISDRAWKKRPMLPLAVKTFGEHVRWMVDTMIATAETGLGTRAVIKLCGALVKDHRVQTYRASEECAMLQQWLNEVRPRNHGYIDMLPTGRAPTLRGRMEKVDHPILELKRCERSETPARLSDPECKNLWLILTEVEPRYYASMRMRIDQTLEMIRGDKYATWAGPQSYRIWLNYQIRRGTFLKIVNYLRELENMPAVAVLPELPGGRRPKPKETEGFQTLPHQAAASRGRPAKKHEAALKHPHH